MHAYCENALLPITQILSTEIIKCSYQYLGGKMGELPDQKKRTVEAAIVRKGGERICVMGSDPCNASRTPNSISFFRNYVILCRITTAITSILRVSPNNAFSQYACITSHYTDPLTPLPHDRLRHRPFFRSGNSPIFPPRC